MKVKEVSRTANVAWSPAGMQAIHVACGTVAQQLDATFSTSAKLEVFSLDLGRPGLEMTLVGAVDTPHRFHRLIWSGQGMGVDYASGLIVGGSDNGIITLWNAQGIMESSSTSAISTLDQHTGAVRSLDINPFQSNLLASGASESEIFVWDLNNLATPMSPGNKTHPLEDISGVSWNRQVQHILASTSPSGRSVVWDLRKNEPIIQVADTSSRIQCSGIAWHPDVATQLVTSSVDDRSPIIQMWDLRFATSPMRILEQHKRGVLSLAWCPQDSDLLLSAAKDNRVLCWNPNSETPGGEVVYELPSTSQWIFECQWCPRNPGVISTASFDGHVTMYSLLGGGGASSDDSAHSEVMEPSSAASSGSDFFDGVKNISVASRRATETAPLKTPPKWFRRPCGANFGFGGKLVSFTNTRGASVPKTVYVSSVVTEQDFLHRSRDLEDSLLQGKFSEFCERKVRESSAAADRNMWSFLKVTFEEDSRRQYLKLLGYDIQELEKKFATWSKMSVSTLPSAGGLDITELSNKLATIPTTLHEKDGEEGDSTTNDETLHGSSETSSTAAMFGSDADGRGSVFDSLSMADPTSSHASKRVSNAGVPTTPPSSLSSFPIPTDGDPDGMLAKALLVGNFEAAVDICISSDRMAEAMVLAVAGGADLLKRTQQAFFNKKPGKVTKLISSVVNRNWTEMARYGSLENWREILAALVTYAGPDEFAPLCDILGNRLEKEMDPHFSHNATLCYICSGNLEKFVECLTVRSSPDADSAAKCNPLTLQNMMEKIVYLKKAVELQRRQYSETTSEALNKKLQLYAGLLTSQGALETAYKYLSTAEGNMASAVLKERLYEAQGLTSLPRPEFPFPAVDITTAAAAAAVQPQTTPSAATPKGDVVSQQQEPYQQMREPDQASGLYTGQTGFVNSMGSPGNFIHQEVIPVATSQGADMSSVSNSGIFNPGATSTPSTVTPPSGSNLYSYGGVGAWNDPPQIRAKKVAHY